ncbi:MAG TPA: glycoside hydrolase family 44 protein, partial [Holophagaceae bacterium]
MPLPASLRSLLRPTLLLGLAGLGVVGCGGGSSASAAGGTSASTLQAPANLTATPGDGQVLLSWAPSAGAVGYHVQRTTTSGGPYSLIGSPTIATYADTGVSNGTTYFYVVSAIYSSGESPASAQVSATPSAAPPGRLTVVLDPTAPHPISPYIYGLNFATQVMGAPPQLTLDRAGGNRWTAYNWETNASNAGSDYLYENDAYLSSSSTPGEAVQHVIAGDQALGMASLVTFQLQGLVAGDENGPVSTANPPDMTRFKQVVPKKSTVSSLPFTATPPTTDDAVFMDEFLWALDQAFPGQSIFGASPTHPTFVELDNEPELWNSTHLEIQGSRPVTSDAYLAKTLALARAL